MPSTRPTSRSPFSPEKLLKVAAAFIAGVILSIGGALIYSSHQNQDQPVSNDARLASRVPVEQNLTPAVLHEPSSVHAQLSPQELQQAEPEADAARSSAKPVGRVENQSASEVRPTTRAEHPVVVPEHPAPFASAPQLTADSQVFAQPPASVQPVAVTSAASGAPAPKPQPVTEQPVAQPNPLPASPARKLVTLPEGTAVAIRVAESLSSDRNRAGDIFRGSLAAPLTADGVVIARTGSTVLGRVITAHRPPLIGGRSELTLSLTDLTTTDGKLVKVETAGWEREGSHTNVVNTAKMATGAAIGAVVGAFSGAAEGAGISSGLRNNDRTNAFVATRRVVLVPAGSEIRFILTAALTTESTEQ
ncbi:MAG: hypothetical protein JOZ62_09185 [Acidobacteriaceae bacterium]|nr:hypothetical protein [Acidobacteriaceae bacterium]